jgi:hypothetical protein
MKQARLISVPVDLWITCEFAVIIKTSRRARPARNQQRSVKATRLNK